jgi:hypothetical protein
VEAGKPVLKVGLKSAFRASVQVSPHVHRVVCKRKEREDVRRAEKCSVPHFHRFKYRVRVDDGEMH